MAYCSCKNGDYKPHSHTNTHIIRLKTATLYGPGKRMDANQIIQPDIYTVVWHISYWNEHKYLHTAVELHNKHVGYIYSFKMYSNLLINQ